MTLIDFACIGPIIIDHTHQRHGRYGHMAVAGSLPTDGWPSRSYGTWVPNSGRQDLMIRWGYQRFYQLEQINLDFQMIRWGV